MNKKYIFIVAGFLFLVGGYIFWNQYYNSSEEIWLQNDKSGGNTPQDTINLFVLALEKKDMALAASYFIEGGEIRKEDWQASFQKINEQGFIDEMVMDIKKAIPDPANSGSLEYRYFLNGVNPQGGVIFLKYNSYTNVWKIQTL